MLLSDELALTVTREVQAGASFPQKTQSESPAPGTHRSCGSVSEYVAELGLSSAARY